MTNEELLKEIASLPDKDREKIEHFIALLKRSGTARPSTPNGSFRDDPAFGMWKDREDMKDSVEWVRNTRRTHWRQRS